MLKSGNSFCSQFYSCSTAFLILPGPGAMPVESLEDCIISLKTEKNTIKFFRKRLLLSYIFCMFFAWYIAQRKICSAKMHRVWAETRPESLTPCRQEIHWKILSWKAHLQVKMLDAHQVRQRWWVFIGKVPFCNLFVSNSKVQSHFCHEYKILMCNKTIWP